MNLFKKLFSRGKEETPDLPPEFLQETPPDWLIDAKGQRLPNGNTLINEGMFGRFGSYPNSAISVRLVAATGRNNGRSPR